MSLAAGVAVLLGTSAQAETFHFMQIERVIGGVNGEICGQAIQLRMRSVFQCFVGGSNLFVHDAEGKNRIHLIDFTAHVPGCEAGDTVLVASETFAEFVDGEVDIDFPLTELIPESYFAAGSLTFENDVGTIYWRLSWGGDDYTGSNEGATTNDDDFPVGDFGPPFPGPLPSDGVQALFFDGPHGDQSTSNADDYELTEGPAVFTNNAGDSAAVTATACPWDLSGDGVVGVSDILDLFEVWKPCPGPPCCPGDLDGSGFVGVGDLLAMFAHWGVCPE